MLQHLLVLDAKTRTFYQRVMQTLHERQLPFMVAGAYALRHHTGITRQTKDLDLFVRREDVEGVLSALEEAGFKTELSFSHWLAKVYDGDDFIDLIFNSGNGLAPVDSEFFQHAPHGTCFDVPIRWCPVEEMIWSKAFVMERERFDGADIAHLLRVCAPSLDWQRLIDRFGVHWRPLLAHLVLFGFIYPNERELIPRWVMEEFSERLRREACASEELLPVCAGTLLSRQQFLVDVCEHGYLDARVTTGAMTETEVEDWTAAIGRRSEPAPPPKRGSAAK